MRSLLRFIPKKQVHLLVLAAEQAGEYKNRPTVFMAGVSLLPVAGSFNPFIWFKEKLHGMQKGAKSEVMQLQLPVLRQKGYMLRMYRVSLEKPRTSRLLLSRRCRTVLWSILRAFCAAGRAKKDIKAGFNYFEIHPGRPAGTKRPVQWMGSK
jgi:hypothetical protein